MMLNVGYVLGEFPVLSETFIGTEMRALQQLGLNIQPFAFELHAQGGQQIDQAWLADSQAISSVRLGDALGSWLRNPKASFTALNFVLRQRGLPKASLMLAAGKLASLARRQQCQHLHAHFALHTSATAIVAAKLNQCRVSFVGHGYDVYATPKDLALKLATADLAVAVCQDMQQRFAEHAQTVALVPCGIDLARYPFQPASNHNGRLLFVGRLVEKKGLSDALQALATIPVSERPGLDIVGAGPLAAPLYRLAQTLGVDQQVRLLGAKQSEWLHQHAADYLAMCAPFCEADNGDRDTGPVVVKEAMALGLPVITTRFMGCQEMLNDDSGFLVTPNAIDELAQAILRCAKQSVEQRSALLKQARATVERQYSAELSGQQLAQALMAVNA